MNHTTLDPGPLADVAVRSADDRWTLIFSRDLSLRLSLDVPVLGFVHDQLCGLRGDLAHLREQGA